MTKANTIITIFLYFFLSSLSAQSVFFDYKTFKKTDGLSLSSDAKVVKNKIELTPAQKNRRGGVWFADKKIPVSDTFQIEFCFRIHKNGGSGPSGKGGEGLAVVIHNNEYHAKNGSKGEGLGYAGIPNSIAIEFDAQDTEDMEAQHISVQTNGVDENSFEKEYSIAAMKLEKLDLKDGKLHHVKISYSNYQMSIFVDNKKILRFPFNILHHINLDSGKAWVGICAATGDTYAVHELSCFTMQSTQKKITYEEGREVSNTKKMTVQTKILKIRVWDNNQEDGDIISIKLNDKWVIRHFTLSNAGDEFEVELEGQLNYLIVHAHNLGSIPPNTCSVAILGENGQQEATLRSNMQVSDALTLEYHKKSKKEDKIKEKGKKK